MSTETEFEAIRRTRLEQQAADISALLQRNAWLERMLKTRGTPGPEDLARAEFDLANKEMAEHLLKLDKTVNYMVDPCRFINGKLSEMWKLVRAREVERMEMVWDRWARNEREGIKP